jgi:hypothetical protein
MVGKTEAGRKRMRISTHVRPWLYGSIWSDSTIGSRCIETTDLGKRRSLSQRIGKKGESLFSTWAVDHHLSPNNRRGLGCPCQGYRGGVPSSNSARQGRATTNARGCRRNPASMPFSSSITKRASKPNRVSCVCSIWSSFLKEPISFRSATPTCDIVSHLINPLKIGEIVLRLFASAEGVCDSWYYLRPSARLLFARHPRESPTARTPLLAPQESLSAQSCAARSSCSLPTDEMPLAKSLLLCESDSLCC